jgi:hypothetical protein
MITTFQQSPEPGEIWQHFKGDRYEIIGVSTVVEQEVIHCARANRLVPTFYAIDTETLAAIAVFRMFNGALWAAEFCGLDGGIPQLRSLAEPYCFYKKPGVLGVWGRSLQEFMEPKDDGLRFTKVD